MAEDRDLPEATIKNEGQQQLGDEKLLKVSAQDHKDQWSDSSEERTMGTDVTKCPSACILPSSPFCRTSDAPEQAKSFSPEKNKSPQDDYFDLASDICGVDVDEDEPKAKRWSNESKGAIDSPTKTMRRHRATVRIRSKNELPADGYTWNKYGQKIIEGNPHERCYYRCSTRGCPVRKWVEKDSKDTRFLIITYEGIHDHHGLYNLHSQLWNDRRANNMEDVAEAAKTIRPTKGDVFEASIQDKEYAGIPIASIRDESQKSEDENMLEVPKQAEDQQPDSKTERVRTNVINIIPSTLPTMSPPASGLMRPAKLPDHPVLMDNSIVLPSPTTGEFAGQLLNQKSNSGIDQQSITQEDNNSSDVCHLPPPSSSTTSSMISELSETILPTVQKEPGGLKMESSLSKKARATNSGTHQVSCLLDDCNADLSNSKRYHRRHKVCELHCKAAQVMINGRMQRFCQQCSRFHSLEEFDEGKRSCRRRLAGHNRRRKPQSPTWSVSYFSSYQDSDRALSLLSSPKTQTSGISLSNMVQQPHLLPLVQPLGPSLQNRIIEPMDSVVVANGRYTAIHGPGMFHMSSDGSSGSEAPQTLPFLWHY